MAAAERDRIAAAARLRRTGPRTFQRPPRTLSSTLCRGQYSGLQSDYFGAVLSPAPPANETRFHQTARDHDAKEFVAGRICVIARERIYEWKVRGNSGFSRSWTGQQNETRDSLFGQNLLRPYQLPRGKEDRQRRHHSNGTALSVARNEIEIDDESFSENDRNRLVPGRTGEYGRMEFHRAAFAQTFRTRNRLCRSRCQREPRRRLARATQARTSLRRYRRLQGLTIVIPSGARDLTVEVGSTQTNQRDPQACERSFTSFRMTT